MRSERTAPWRVIYITRGEQQAREIEALLTQAGFMVERKQSLPDGPRQEDIEIKAL